MSRNKVITADAAAGLVLAGDTIATTGFVGTGFPEELALALERRFPDTGDCRDSAEQAWELAAYLDRRLTTLGHRVHAVVNYDNLELGLNAEDVFFTMIRDSTEKHFLSATHYSTNAFFRHQLGGRFTEAQLGQTIYPTFAAAREGTRE